MVSSQKIPTVEGGRARLLSPADIAENTQVSAYAQNAEAAFHGLNNLLDEDQTFVAERKGRILQLAGRQGRENNKAVDAEKTRELNYRPVADAINAVLDRKNEENIDPVLKEQERLAALVTEDEIAVLEVFTGDSSPIGTDVLDIVVDKVVRPGSLDQGANVEVVRERLKAQYEEAAEALKSKTITVPELQALEQRILETINDRNLREGEEILKSVDDIPPEWLHLLAKTRVKKIEKKTKADLVQVIDAETRATPLPVRREMARNLRTESKESTDPSQESTASPTEETVIKPRAQAKPKMQAEESINISDAAKSKDKPKQGFFKDLYDGVSALFFNSK